MAHKETESTPRSPLYSGGRRRGLFSPLMRRVLVVNVIALAILGAGILYLGQFRENLVQQRTDTLLSQADIIAGALGETAAGPESVELNIALARQIMVRLVDMAHMQARLYSTRGELMIDSRFLSPTGQVIQTPLPPDKGGLNFTDRLLDQIDRVMNTLAPTPSYEPYNEAGTDGPQKFQEVEKALDGRPAVHIRKLTDETLVINVAIPVQRFRRVLGVLLLTASTQDIEQLIRAERLNTLRVFAISLGVTLLLTLFLSSTIARPIRVLAAAADRVRRGIGRAEALDIYNNRKDEIGDLSRALNDMTQALYHQIDAVESFAADVAHELKNPLSSVRSAVESMALTKDPDVQARLLAVIQDDVRRLDRLITDISDASRLDAELSRGHMEPVDLGVLVSTLVDIYRTTGSSGDVRIELEPPERGTFMVSGIEGRLGQVVRNLIENAISFSPAGGKVSLDLERLGNTVIFRVKDEGPGLPEGAEKRIFERFYSERPETEAFGTHSGLGLSISRQIINAHDGSISATNRADHTGALFTVKLPAHRS